MDMLKEINVSASDCDLKKFPNQFVDMISDGSWAIRTDSLKTARKPPKFITEQLLKPATNPAKFDDIASGDYKDVKAVEAQNILAFVQNEFSKALCIPFYEVDGPLVIYANARLVKMLSEMFPNCDWYAAGVNKPLYLVNHASEHAVAILMPFTIEKDLTELRQPTKPEPALKRVI